MVETILSSAFFTEVILPFLLVFTIIFAILDKIKILGEGKRQINAIVAFVIGLLLIAFPFARNIIANLMPVLAVIVVVLLVFMLLYGFASGGKEFAMPKGLKITFGILIGIVLIITLIVVSGYWDKVVGVFSEGNSLFANIIFIAVIIAAFAVVLATGGKSTGSGG